MTAYLLERAWVDGEVRDEVYVEIEDGRFSAVELRAGSRRFEGVATRTNVSDTRFDRVSRPDQRPHHPGPRELPQPRVPPGVEGEDAAGAGDVLDVAGADVRRRGAAGPGLLPRPRHSHLQRDGRERHHQRRGVPLPAPPAGRDAVRRPERHGARADPGSRGSGPQDPAARHGVPQQRLRRATPRRPTQVLRRHRRRVGRARSTDERRRHPLRPRRPRRPAAHDRRGQRGQAAPRPPLRADRGERRVRGGVRRHAHPAARRPRRPRTAHQRGARDAPDRATTSATSATRVPSPASAPPPSATSGTASAPAARSTTRAARSPSAPTAMP